MKRVLTLAAIILAMTACQKRTNPFFAEWDTPYGIPPYEKILPEDYIPAIKAGIEEQTAEIEAITANPDGGMPGTSVTLTAVPDTGYRMPAVMSVNGQEFETVNGAYSFTMPAQAVTVSAVSLLR